LGGTGYQGPLGIILCDGGSDFLRRSRNIIDEFFRTHPRINFILAFEAIREFGHDAHNRVRFYYEKGEGVGAELDNFLSNFENYSDALFPRPVRSALGAVYALEATKAHRGDSFSGGMSVSGNEIKLSARTVLDLLAGKTSYEEFPEEYKDYFRKMAAEGRLFAEARVEKDEHEKDDDWLVFRFGRPDPAVTPYVVPKAAKS
jgi:hypothetical protein